MRTPALSGTRRLGWWAAAALLPASLLLASCTTEAPTDTTGTPPAANGGGTSAGGNSAEAAFTSPRKADGKLNIQIITNGISPFWDPMAIGMEKFESEHDDEVDADWQGPQNATVTEQKQMVENALAKGADGIAISCIEAKASEPIIRSVLEKGIPIITFDADSPESGRLVYIGTNNFNAGKAAGGAAVELMPGGGKMVGFVGNISAQNARERRDGFVEATKDHKIELLEVIDDNKDASRARRNVEDAMAKHGDSIQGFLGLFSYNGPAIAQAVNKPGQARKYKIVCFDAEPVTLVELGKGNIDATVVQKPYDFGYLSAKLLYLINRKGLPAAMQEMNIPEDRLYDTGVEVITPKNVREYKQNLEKLGVKSS